MKSQKRKAGFEFLKDFDWGIHICLLYQNKEEIKHIMVPYFLAGLENNEFCLWITSEVMNRTEVIETMKTEVPDFEQYLNCGQMEIVPYTELYFKKGKFDQQRVINDLFRKLVLVQENGYEITTITDNGSGINPEHLNRIFDPFFTTKEVGDLD